MLHTPRDSEPGPSDSSELWDVREAEGPNKKAPNVQYL